MVFHSLFLIAKFRTSKNLEINHIILSQLPYKIAEHLIAEFSAHPKKEKKWVFKKGKQKEIIVEVVQLHVASNIVNKHLFALYLGEFTRS